MDFKLMKRKELQALCKKHGIPANTTNLKMIESLSSILEEKNKPKGCLKSSEGNGSSEDTGVLRVGSKKVTFVIEDEKEDEAEEYTVDPVAKLPRKSTRRSSIVAPELEKGSSFESLKNVNEVLQRTRRSSVFCSPVVEEEEKRQLRNGTKGVRQNAEEKGSVDVVPSTRSLRSRTVVVGGSEELASEKNARKTPKRKKSNENGENGDVAAGRRNLRKRSRDVDSLENEPACRRSNRNCSKLEETLAIEEVDAGRSKKPRKGVMGASVVENVADEETGGASKRLRGDKLNCDANVVAGQNKAPTRGKARTAKQGDSTNSISDNGAVSVSTRRLARSSSSLLQDVELVRTGKSIKQGKDCTSNGGDLASLLPGVVAGLVRKSTRSSSTLMGEVRKATKKGKSEEQGTNSCLKGEGSTISLPDSEVVTEPVRKSTRISSALCEDKASLHVVGESVKDVAVVRKGKSRQRQSKNHAPKGGVSEASLSHKEAIAPRNDASKQRGLRPSLPNIEAVTTTTRGSTCSSSKFLKDEMLNKE